MTSAPAPSWLPEVLREIAAVAGLDAALALAEGHGGTRRKIPASAPDDDHWLVQCVGRVAADAICAHFRQGVERQAGQEILIPLGPTGTMRAARQRMIRALEQGASGAEAARAAGMHERSAYRMRRRIKDEDQGSLL